MIAKTEIVRVSAMIIPLFVGNLAVTPRDSPAPPLTLLANDRRTATVQIDFKRTMNEKEVRETLRDFNVRLVRASNNSSRSSRWTVDIETRDADNKLERELKATRGVGRVKRLVIKQPAPNAAKKG